MQFDIRRVKAHNLSANATELRPIALRSHATAVDDKSGIGQCPSFDGGLPVTFDLSFFEGDRHRFKEGTIIDMRFIGDVQSFGKAGGEWRFHFPDSCTINPFGGYLGLRRVESSLS